MWYKILTFQTEEPKPTTSADFLSIITDCDNSTIIQGHLKIVKVSKCSDTYLVSVSFF